MKGLQLKMQTTSYWKISPWGWGKDPQGWEGQWQLCLREKMIAMGRGKGGDLRNLGENQKQVL